MNIEIPCPNCKAPLEFEVSPGRRAPDCWNHDDPRFSDSGEGPEIQSGNLKCECGYELEETDVLERLEE